MARFYGQRRLLREIDLLEKEIMSGRCHNILFAGPSGYGKTTLALRMAMNTVGPEKTSYGVPPNFFFIPAKPFNFLDEIHLLDEPENLYPFLDQGDTTFVLATNELGALKEPLVNRCIPLVFDPYSIEDITDIVLDNLSEFGLSRDLGSSIAERCKFNPRIAVMLCKRLTYVFQSYGTPDSLERLDELSEQILDVDKRGLTATDKRYLDLLKKSGGFASLNLIQYSLGYTRETVLRDIEPGLIRLGLVRITSKGRELINGYSS